MCDLLEEDDFNDQLSMAISFEKRKKKGREFPPRHVLSKEHVKEMKADSYISFHTFDFSCSVLSRSVPTRHE